MMVVVEESLQQARSVAQPKAAHKVHQFFRRKLREVDTVSLSSVIISPSLKPANALGSRPAFASSSISPWVRQTLVAERYPPSQ